MSSKTVIILTIKKKGGTFAKSDLLPVEKKGTSNKIESYSAAQTQNQHMPPASFLTRRLI